MGSEQLVTPEWLRACTQFGADWAGWLQSALEEWDVQTKSGENIPR